MNHNHAATSPVKTFCACVAEAEVAEEQDGREDAADQHDEHDRVAGLHAGIELAEAVDDRRSDDRRLEQRPLAPCPAVRDGVVGKLRLQRVLLEREVLDDGAERQGREEGEPTDDDDDADDEADEQRGVRGEGAGGGGHHSLASEGAGEGEHGKDRGRSDR